MSDHPPSDPAHRGRLALRVAAALIIAALVAAHVWVVRERRAYAAEVARLRSSMSDVERQRADEVVARERHALGVAIALLRRQARLEPDLHLAVSVDSARMYLEREGALLRDMPVSVGSERRVGLPPDTVWMAAPRGVRTIAGILTDGDAWDVPPWVYVDRGIPVDSMRRITGALGAVAVLLDGGAIIYSLPGAGPLNDSSYVLPGAIRARGDDLRAILPNLAIGMRVYFY